MSLSSHYAYESRSKKLTVVFLDYFQVRFCFRNFEVGSHLVWEFFDQQNGKFLDQMKTLVKVPKTLSLSEVSRKSLSNIYNVIRNHSENIGTTQYMEANRFPSLVMSSRKIKSQRQCSNHWQRNQFRPFGWSGWFLHMSQRNTTLG